MVAFGVMVGGLAATEGVSAFPAYLLLLGGSAKQKTPTVSLKQWASKNSRFARLVGGVGFNLVAGQCTCADGRHGRMTLGEVQLLAVRLGVAGGDFQGMMGRNASTYSGHGRVALNKVRAMRGRVRVPRKHPRASWARRGRVRPAKGRGLAASRSARHRGN